MIPKPTLSAAKYPRRGNEPEWGRVVRGLFPNYSASFYFTPWRQTLLNSKTFEDTYMRGGVPGEPSTLWRYYNRALVRYQVKAMFSARLLDVDGAFTQEQMTNLLIVCNDAPLINVDPASTDNVNLCVEVMCNDCLYEPSASNALAHTLVGLDDAVTYVKKQIEVPLISRELVCCLYQVAHYSLCGLVVRLGKEAKRDQGEILDSLLAKATKHHMSAKIATTTQKMFGQDLPADLSLIHTALDHRFTVLRRR